MKQFHFTYFMILSTYIIIISCIMYIMHNMWCKKNNCFSPCNSCIIVLLFGRVISLNIYLNYLSFFFYIFYYSIFLIAIRKLNIFDELQMIINQIFSKCMLLIVIFILNFYVICITQNILILLNNCIDNIRSVDT